MGDQIWNTIRARHLCPFFDIKGFSRRDSRGAQTFTNVEKILLLADMLRLMKICVDDAAQKRFNFFCGSRMFVDFSSFLSVFVSGGLDDGADL